MYLTYLSLKTYSASKKATGAPCLAIDTRLQKQKCAAT